MSTIHPLVIIDEPPVEVDLTRGYDIDLLRTVRWGIGGYFERRTSEMYDSHIYTDGRTVHVGIDIWGAAGTLVHAFADGMVWGLADNDNPRDYGPTVVTQHQLSGETVWALYGHLSRASLLRHQPGDRIRAGDVVGEFGTEAENGGWLPHLHFQIAREEPTEADMPGVVHPDDIPRARRIYPNPEDVLERLWKVAGSE